MATLNNFQLFSGHFFLAEYLQYDVELKNFVKYPPVEFRYKPADISSQGVSSSGKTTTSSQNIEGNVFGKRQFAISTTAPIEFGKKDKIRIINENRLYSIESITEGYDSINSLVNLNFPRLKKNKPQIIFLK